MTEKYVMRALGFANGVHCPHKGQYLKSFDHEHGNGGKGEKSEVLHRRYFDRASAAPSQFGGGGFIRK